ncbi:hypothetical protein [Nocardioides marmoraquaticus]
MAQIGTRSLTISIGGTEARAELSQARITSGESDSDFVTFADAAAGGAREYKLAFTAAQDAVTGSVWDRVWSNPGATVACILRPYGNTTPTVAQPHYGFNAIITEPDGDFLGGEADASATAKFTIECEWPLTAKPNKITA